jgi:16S rRNA (uracil1498-N3)-methyltransferase
MKQSLRAWMPKVSYANNISEIYKLDGTKFLFDQKAEKNFLSTLNSQFSIGNCFFIFGPEGGFSEEELRMANLELRIKLTDNRLRSETAIVAAASELAMNLNS